MINNEPTYKIIYLKDTSFTKNNVYIIVDLQTKSAAIVDPACDLKQIIDVIVQEELKLELILLTHSHPDHVRRVDDLVNKYHCRVLISRKEAMNYFFHSQNLHVFDDSDTFYLENTKIQCLVTPGHTSGSTCFLLDNSIFTGDTIFMEGCGLCTGNGSSVKSMFQSIQRIKQLVDDNISVYPGHTYQTLPGKPMSFLKHNNIYFALDEKRFIAFRMRKNQKNLFKFI